GLLLGLDGAVEPPAEDEADEEEEPSRSMPSDSRCPAMAASIIGSWTVWYILKYRATGQPQSGTTDRDLSTTRLMRHAAHLRNALKPPGRLEMLAIARSLLRII